MEHRDGRVPPHDPDNIARIYEDDQGRKWVTHEELLECGYILLSDFDVVYLNAKFYELQAYTRRANAWWVEEIELDEEVQKVPEGEISERV